MRATMSILGLYEYDESVFDGFSVPAGVDRQTAIDSILAECAELEIVYPDFDTMRFLIENWSARELNVWGKLYKTTTFEYDPISNYDRTETITDAETTDTTINTSDNNTAVNRVAGYNTGNFVNSDESTMNNTGTNTGKNQRSYTHNARMYGNIGVTTTQEMIEQERKTADWCIYDFIVESFKKRFCLLVY